MLFSVIIPTYNRGSVISETLSSVFRQTFRDFEVIVVDDGSTDNTPEVLASVSDRIRVIKGANRGASVARNIGAANASGRYLAFLDSDDIWPPWTLETYYRAIMQNHQPSLLRAAVVEFVGAPPVLEYTSPRWRSYKDYLSSSRDLPYLGSGMTIVKRESFLEADGFESTLSIGEDQDFGMRIGILQGFISILSPVTLAYRRHPGSISLDLDRAFQDALLRLQREFNGCYPGGRRRALDRWRYLTASIRPVIVALIEQEKRASALNLYLKTLKMHLVLCRTKFLCGVPCLAALSLVRDMLGEVIPRTGRV